MALKGKILKTEFDALGDPLKAEYKPLKDKQGQPVKSAEGVELYALDAPDMLHNDDVTALRSALENERQTSNQRQERITSLETQTNQQASQIEALKQKKGNEGGLSDAEKQQLLQAHSTEKEKLIKDAERYRQSLDQVMRREQLRSVILKAKGVPELLLPALEGRTKLEENSDGSFRVVVLNEQGAPAIGDAQGNPKTLEQLVEEVKANPVYGRAFEPSNAGGGGTPPNQPGGATTISKRSDLKTPADKAKYIGEHGHEAYVELPE